MAEGEQGKEDPEVTALKAAKAKLDAEKAKIDAEKAKLDSEKALNAAKQSSAELDELQRRKTIADAQKNAAIAETDALKAQYFGDVKAGAYSGAVDLKEGVGKAEAAMLAAHAMAGAACEIARRVAPVAGTFYVVAGKELPAVQQLMTFRFRKELALQALVDAIAAVGERVEAQEGALEEMASLAAVPAVVSAGLDAVSNVLKFFKTDYTVGGVEVKLEEPALLFAIAGHLRSWDKTVYLPSIHQLAAQQRAVSALIGELKALSAQRAKGQTAFDALAQEIRRWDEQIAAAPDAQSKKQLENSRLVAAGKQQKLKGAIELCDAFMASLTAAEGTPGALPANALIQQYAIEGALASGAAVLLVKLENTGGGYLVKKNLLTGLGAMPLYHMGGATVSYLLFKGAEGAVIDGGIVPRHGGFVQSGALANHLRCWDPITTPLEPGA